MNTPEGSRGSQLHLMVGAKMIKAGHQVVGASLARLSLHFVWPGIEYRKLFDSASTRQVREVEWLYLAR